MRRLIFTSGLVLLLFVSTAEGLGQTARECRVPEEFKTIRAAIDDKACETITVAAGTYTENLEITRSLTLTGAGYDQTTIKAASSGQPTIVIYGDDITATIEGVTVTGGNDGISVHGTAKATIQDSRISDNRGEDISSGIEVWDSTQVTIQHNIISGNWFNGIWIADSVQVSVTHNQIFNNDYDGIELLVEPKAEISDNEITNNGRCGIHAYPGSTIIPPFTGEVTGVRNKILGNKEGELCPLEGPKRGVTWPEDFIGTPKPDPEGYGPGPRVITLRCPVDSIGLKPNEFMTGQKIGPEALTEVKKDQYCIPVAPEAKMLAIKLDSKGNLDMHIRHGKPVERSGKIIVADFSLPSPDGSEFIIIFSPQLKAGPYFIAVENKEDIPQEFTIIATPIADIQALKSGEPKDGSVDPNAGLLPFLRQYLETRKGLLSLTQYKFDVPKGAKSVTIQLLGPRDKNLDLHLRYGKPVEIRPDGGLEADLSLPGPIGEEAVVISGALLKPESLYIAVENLEKEKQSFKILVTVDTGGGLQTFIFQ